MKMEYKRQHPYFMLSKICSRIKEFIVSIIILIGAVMSKGENKKIIIFSAIILIAVIIIAATIINWTKDVYSYDEKGIHIKEGLIKRKFRYIPCDKIHTMDMDAKFIQRLFGVATLRIDTASGGKEAEVCLVLKENEVYNIKKVIYNEGEKKVTNKEDNTQGEKNREETSNKNIYYKATIVDLIIMAATSKYIMGGIFFILVIYNKLNDIIPQNLKNKFSNFESKSAENIMTIKSIQIIIAIVMVVIIITFIISIITTVIKYYDFTVTRDKNKINITYGLFDKKSVVIPLYRIQSISIVEGILKKPFNFVSINVESIGYGKEKGESTMLCPLLKKNKIDEFFKEVLNEVKPEFKFSYASNKAIIGYLIRNALIPMIIGILITWKFKYGFFILIIEPFFFLLGYFKYKNAAICIVENKLIMQFRILAKYTVIMSRKNIQSAVKTQSIFQKRNNLINIKTAVQGELVQKEYIIKGMNNIEFTKLQQWLLNI